MSEFSVLARFIDFDVDTRNLTLALDFLDQDTQRNIEQAVTDGKQTKVIFKLKFNQTRKQKHQHIWYGSLALILRSDSYKTAPIAENLEDLDDYLRESIFPVRKRIIGGKEIPKVARIKDLSDEEMEKCIATLHNRYDYLTVNGKPIDFSYLKTI